MDILRFALVGAGNIAKIYVQAFAVIPDAKITVVCSRTEATGRALAEQCGAEWVGDFHEAVRRDDVDAVVVATPSGTHADVAVAAAQAGKHLLVEKPLDITLARVDSILNAVKESGVVLASVYPLRFTEGAQRAKAAVDAGRLGQLTLADVYVKWWRPQSYYDNPWRGKWAVDGGGALMNQAIHNVDLVQWLAGPVTSVVGRTTTLAHEMETEDTMSALLTFANGALGVIQGATSCWPGDPARVELHGDRGTIVLEEGRIVTWKLQDAAPGEEEAMLALEHAAGSGAADPMAIGFEKHRRQVVDLIEAIRTGRSPAIRGEEARRSVEIVRAIYRSAQTNSTVTLPLLDDQ
jgi:UDP-N-acetyl-2-amino-2-deoxyglucuronate dehydrogenase